MIVAVKHMVPVWVEVDLKTKQIDRVVVDDEAIGKPLEYRVVLDDGMYDNERYAGRKMAQAVRKILDVPKMEWPEMEIGW